MRSARGLRRANTLASGGIVLYSQPGATVNTQTSYSVVIPAGVLSIGAVAIGAGGGGGGAGSSASAAAGGGGGGALVYTNSIPVTPGETLTVLVPNQSAAGSNSGGNGGNGLSAQILRSATVLLSAAGGSGSIGTTSTSATAGAIGGQAASSIGDVLFSGGTGGAGNASTDNGGGGGGAAGYAGTGGTGGTGGLGNGTAGSGGGGGGGSSNNNSTVGGHGGGTLWYGVGDNGAAGSLSSTQSVLAGNLGSSLGGSESILISPTVAAGTENNVGMPGGGGAGAPSGGTSAYTGMRGAGGAVRILWGQNIDFGNPSSDVSYNQIQFVTYTTSSTSSITMPQVKLGDTVIIVDYSENTTGVPTAVTPAGFTLRLNVASTTRRLTTYSRQILSASETGTVLTGANGTAKNAKFAIVISGTAGASYSPRGTDVANGNGAIGVTTAYSTTYTETGMDPYAQGIPVGFLFFNSTGDINPATDMTYAGAATLAGPDSKTYIKLLTYNQLTTSLNIPLATSNLGTNTYNFWTTKFF